MELLCKFLEFQEQDGFVYLRGEGDLLNDVLTHLDAAKLNVDDAAGLALLRCVITQPSTLYCGSEGSSNSIPPCCLVHVVSRIPVSQWKDACILLDRHLRDKLTQLNPTPREVVDVLDAISAEGRIRTVSSEWEDTFRWLSRVLPTVFVNISGYKVRTARTDSCKPNPPIQSNDHAKGHVEGLIPISDAEMKDMDWVKEVIDASNAFFDAESKRLRVGQLAAILLNVFCAMTCRKVMIEVKTGEGKTFVCAISAAVIAKLNPFGTSMILTASHDRAAADVVSTTFFLESYLGKPPSLISSWKSGDFTQVQGTVAYGQVSDVQRLVVDALQNGIQAERFSWFGRSSIFIDEADHVLIEQAENLLFIASPCPSYHALSSFFFQILIRLDFHADYSVNEVSCTSSIQEKACVLSQTILDAVHDERRNNKDRTLYPPIIDTDVCIAGWTSGAFSARLKKNGKEFVLELSTSDDKGTICGVRKITIVDTATGTESDGTRWTSEAPFVEGFLELPVGGSEPLAFFNCFPVLLKKVRWFSGISGTLGEQHCLEYYERTYGACAAFKIPRNVPTSLYHLPTVLSSSEDRWLNRIAESTDSILRGTHGLKAHGPVLIVMESIQKATLLTKIFARRKYCQMKKDVDDSWVVDGNGSPTGPHLYPFYLREHEVPEQLPDCSVAVASNKGGRGLDLGLDGKCPPGCQVVHPCFPQTEMGSVLFVILTEVLLGRQDEQARGRCGRGGKAGVVQYQLLVEYTGQNAESVFLDRKIRKDSFERGDLGTKSNRILQHSYDGWMLEKFCDWMPSYVGEWMKKLFPEELEESEEIATLKPIFKKWLRAYVTELWAYWRGYGGARRKPGDILHHFRCRMGLQSVRDLQNTETVHDGNPVHHFAKLFWSFACYLRISPEALFALVKVLLPINSQLISSFCVDVLERATSPINEVNGSAVTLLPDGEHHPWRAEFSGNAALFLAAMSPDPTKGLRRAVRAISHIIERFEYVLREVKGQEAPSEVRSKANEVTRSTRTYYVVQLREIISQLKYRKGKIESFMGAPTVPAPKHFSVALKDPSLSYTAYCLGYQWCRVVFEWYLGDKPFTARSEKAAAWGAHLKKKALSLQPAQHQQTKSKAPYSNKAAKGKNLGGAGGGATQMQTEAHDEYHKEGETITEAFKNVAKRDSYLVSGAVYKWEPTAPTETDIRSSQMSFWKIVIGWITFALDWIVAQLTGPSRVTRASIGGGSATQSSTNRSKLSADVQKKLDLKVALFREQQKKFSGDLVRKYLAGSAETICQISESLGIHLDQSDLVQDVVTVRKDGKEKSKISHSQAKEEANKEASEILHVKDENLAEEDAYLCKATLNALRKRAAKGELKGFEDEFDRLMRAISEYNNAAMIPGAQINPKVAAAMNAAMKTLWQSLLRLAVDHGDKISELKEALAYRKVKKTRSEFSKVSENVTKKVTEFRDVVVEGTRQVISNAAGGIGWLWGAFQSFVTEAYSWVQRNVPFVKEVVETVTRTVIDPVFKAARDFFNSASSAISLFCERVQKAIVDAVLRLGREIKERALKMWYSTLEYIQQATRTLFDKIFDATQRAAKWLNSVWESQVVRKLLHHIYSTIRTISEILKKAWNSKLMRSVRRTTTFLLNTLNACTAAKWLRTLVTAVRTTAITLFNKLRSLPFMEHVRFVLHHIVNFYLSFEALSTKLLRQFINSEMWRRVLRFNAAFKEQCKSLMQLVVFGVQFMTNQINNLIEKNPILSYIKWQLMYQWQGAGEILEDSIWGNFDFDIVDIERLPEGVTKDRMRRRNALRRVWKSSWLRWFLDPSIRLGLDQQDAREHVHAAQERAHYDHTRHKAEHQREMGLHFATIATVISILAVFATLLSGGALAVPMLALVSSSMTLYLQRLSVAVDRNADLTKEEKESMQAFLSFSQNVLLLTSLTTGAFVSGGALMTEIQVAVTSVARSFGIALTKITAAVKGAAEVARLPKSVRSLLEQIDKVLIAAGIGGGVTQLMENGSVGLANLLLELSSSLLTTLDTMIKTLIEMLEKLEQEKHQQQQEEQEQQQRHKDDDDDTQNSRGGRTTVWRWSTHRTLALKSGSLVQQRDSTNISATKTKPTTTPASSAKGKAPISTSRALCATGTDCGYVFTSSNTTAGGGSDADTKLDISFDVSGKVSFSRALSTEEEELFRNVKTKEDMDTLFDKESSTATSDVYKTHESTTIFDRNNSIVTEKHIFTTSNKGTITTSKDKAGRVNITLSPSSNNTKKSGGDVQLLRVGGNKGSSKMTKDHTSLLLEYVVPEGIDSAGVVVVVDPDDGSFIPTNPSFTAPTTNTTPSSTNNKTLHAALFLLLNKDAPATEEQMAEFNVADERRVLDMLGDAFIKSSQTHGNGRLMEGASQKLLGSLHVGSFKLLSDGDREQFHIDIDKAGHAKAIVNLLAAPPQPLLLNLLVPQEAPPPTVYDTISKTGAGYLRRDTKFRPVSNAMAGVEAKASHVFSCGTSEGGDAVFTGVQRVLTPNQIQSNIVEFVRRGDREGLAAYVKSFVEEGKQIPSSISSVSMNSTYNAAFTDDVQEIVTLWMQLEEEGWGQYSDDAVSTTTNKLTMQMANSVGNLRGTWKSKQMAADIHEKNCTVLEKALNYKCDKEMDEHAQAVLLAITFNNEALTHGSPFRILVDSDFGTTTEGRDLLLIDVRSGREIDTFESKRYTSAASEGVLAHPTNTMLKTAGPKFFPHGTNLVVNSEKVAEAFEAYQFDTTVRAPHTEGSVLSLSAQHSEQLYKRIISLKAGKGVFNMQGPWGGGRKDVVTIKVTRTVEGVFTVKLKA